MRACNDSIPEAGLDERGEAPPPYKPAANDKAPTMSRTETAGLTDAGGVPVGQGMMCSMPPDYHPNDVSERLGVLARPARVVIATERSENVDLEQGRPQNVHPARPVHPNTISPKF
jgi:hypothetical protein